MLAEHVDDLARAALLGRRNVNVVSQQKQKRILPHKIAGAVDRMAVPLTRLLDHVADSLREASELFRLFQRPRLAAENRQPLLGQTPKVPAELIDVLFGGDDADLLDAG